MKYDEPLGLPSGSVRALLTLVLVFAVIVMAFKGVTNEYLISLASAAFGYYFGSRADNVVGDSETIVESQVFEDEEDDTPISIVSGKDLE